jgi:hypothetical protein
MNEITWHESAIWFFIAQKLFFANQYVRKFHKIWKFSKKIQNYKIKNKKIEAIYCIQNVFNKYINKLGKDA